MEEARRRAQDRLGADIESARVIRSGKERYGGVAGFFQQERFVIELELADTGEHETPMQAAPTLESLLDATTDTVSLAAFDNEFERELELVIAGATAGDVTTATSPAAPSLPPRADRRGDASLVARPASSKVSTTAPNRYLDTAPPRPPEGPTPSWTPPTGELVGRLAAAGLREEYLPQADDTNAGLQLARRLAELRHAPAPSLRRGEIIVIIGTVRETTDIASGVVAASPSTGTVIVASHRRLPASLSHPRAHTPQEAGALVFEQRLEGHLSVVIVDGECREEFITQTIAGLHPSTIWAVVPASSGPPEVAELATRCGRLDAIALYGLLTAERPAALIGEKWPIAFVDGWQASPLTLAARLLEAIGVPA
jgi:hypothetical protein